MNHFRVYFLAGVRGPPPSRRKMNKNSVRAEKKTVCCIRPNWCCVRAFLTFIKRCARRELFFFHCSLSPPCTLIVYHNKILFLCVSVATMFVVAFMAHQYRRTSTLYCVLSVDVPWLLPSHRPTEVDFIIKSFLVQFDRKTFIFSHLFTHTGGYAVLILYIYSHLLNRLIALAFRLHSNVDVKKKKKEKRNATKQNKLL